MFLSGTLLNVATVLVGATLGVLAGGRLPARMQSSLTTGLAFFTVAIAVSMAIRLFGADVPTGNDIAVLAALLGGIAVGELLRLQDGLEWLGSWFQRRLSRGPRPSRMAEGFVTASLVFCVGPLTILGSLDNGLRNDMTLLAIKSLLDGVASIAFAAALGPGVYLSAITVLLVQGSIAGGAFALAGVMDAPTILAITATGGLILLGVALRLLELKPVPVANFLPALVLAPLFIRVADWARAWIG
ncbi:MAG: DUF554 domain-containing protein [Candidatus Limnocylindria bacterium]